MKGDRELCMAAVAQDGEALQFASKEMKDNLEPQYWDPTVFLPDMDAGIY